MSREHKRRKAANVIFEAESGAAATLHQSRLESRADIAAEMFHTRVLTVKELFFPSVSTFAGKITEAVEAYQKLYFISVLHIDYAYVTIILLLIGIYNVLNDPLMGIAYDKTRTRWGKARPWIIFSCVPYFLTTTVMYSGAFFFPDTASNDPGKIMFVFIMLFLQETFSTVYKIPRDNMTSLMTPNKADRIALGLFDNYIGDAGGQLIYLIFNPLIELNNKGHINLPLASVFMILSTFAAAVGIAGNVAMVSVCQERILLQPKPAPIQKSMFYIFKNKYAMRNFLAEFSVSWWSDGGYRWDEVTQHDIFGGTIPSFIAYLPYNLFNTLSVAMIPKFQAHFKDNNKRAVILLRFWDYLCMLGMCVGIPFVDKKWTIVGIFALFHGLNALNNGPASVFEAELGREINDYTEYMTGERPDGTFYILKNMIMKVANPLNAVFTIMIMEWTGYDTSLPMKTWIQGDKRIYQKVFFLWQVSDILPKIVKTIPYFFYDLVGEKKEQMYLALNERRALVATDANREITALAEAIGRETNTIPSETIHSLQDKE